MELWTRLLTSQQGIQQQLLHLSLKSRLYSEIGTLAARQFLFQQGLDYRHGTGHGVGAYLEVPGHVDKDTYMQL